MSTQIFPSTAQCPGIDISIERKVEWDTIVQEAVSGKEVRIARRILPRREFGLKFNFLRSSTLAVGQPAQQEMQTFEGFFNQRSGMFDSFLWFDPNDNKIVGQFLGNGDGSNTYFQLGRAMGGFVEPVYAPSTATVVYLNGIAQTSTQFTLLQWGSTSPGMAHFVTAPTSTMAVSADISYYYPVRFNDDNMTFARFVNLIYENKKVGFKSII